MKLVTVVGKTIEDAWFKSIKACVNFGYEYVIDKGEYCGQKRKEFDCVTIHITNPNIRPLACQSQYITPTTDDKITDYFRNYLLNPSFDSVLEWERNEYKYSTWIGPQWMECCEALLVGMGGCNQACISIGPSIKGDKYKLINTSSVESGELVDFVGEFEEFKHPPCLRLLDMRVRHGRLHFFIYFRSHDLISGFPENLGGIQLLKEMCVDYMNMRLYDTKKPLIYDGTITEFSKGLHIYDHYWKLAEEYVGTNDKNNISGVTIIDV